MVPYLVHGPCIILPTWFLWTRISFVLLRTFGTSQLCRAFNISHGNLRPHTKWEFSPIRICTVPKFHNEIGKWVLHFKNNKFQNQNLETTILRFHQKKKDQVITCDGVTTSQEPTAADAFLLLLHCPASKGAHSGPPGHKIRYTVSHKFYRSCQDATRKKLSSNKMWQWYVDMTWFYECYILGMCIETRLCILTICSWNVSPHFL